MTLQHTREHLYVDGAWVPSTGTETLPDFYRALLDGRAVADRGDHAVF